MNPINEYEGFYLGLATELSAALIVDVGCGTGLLACALTRRRHRVVGVDPSPAMLGVARGRPDCEGVRWIGGDARQLGEVGADLAIMTGHVAQIVRDDEGWSATLAAIHQALRPGGRVAFESRNPLAEEWTGWNREESRREVEDAVYGPIEAWVQDTEVDGELVRCNGHYHFTRTDEELVSRAELRFRSRGELERDLSDAGFRVENVFGGWDRRPAEVESPEMIFVAVRG